jgi:hypothetical protein
MPSRKDGTWSGSGNATTTVRESRRTCGRRERVGELRVEKKKTTHFGTTGGGCRRRVCKEGRHVVVVEVGGGMGESRVRVVLIVRG